MDNTRYVTYRIIGWNNNNQKMKTEESANSEKHEKEEPKDLSF